MFIREPDTFQKTINVLFSPMRVFTPSCIAFPRTIEHSSATMFENPE